MASFPPPSLSDEVARIKSTTFDYDRPLFAVPVANIFSWQDKTEKRFLLIGGFLGAGKTTLIGRLTKHLEMNHHKVALISDDSEMAHSEIISLSLTKQWHHRKGLTSSCSSTTPFPSGVSSNYREALVSRPARTNLRERSLLRHWYSLGIRNESFRTPSPILIFFKAGLFISNPAGDTAP
ncbi:MAG: hypothetical protein ACJAVK_000121 [Akkermansiaceae bacterium]|jgi:hypothetical protein